MAEIWKLRARKPLAIGPCSTGAISGFVYHKGDSNRNDISICLQIGEHRLVMTQAEWEHTQENTAKIIHEFETR